MARNEHRRPALAEPAFPAKSPSKALGGMAFAIPDRFWRIELTQLARCSRRHSPRNSFRPPYEMQNAAGGIPAAFSCDEAI